MATSKNRESVYISVQSLGVKQAVSDIKSVVSPLEAATKQLRDFQVASTGFGTFGSTLSTAFKDVDKQTDKLIKQQTDFQKTTTATNEQMVEILDSIDSRSRRSALIGFLKTSKDGFLEVAGAVSKWKGVLFTGFTAFSVGRKAVQDLHNTLDSKLVGGVKGLSNSFQNMATSLKTTVPQAASVMKDAIGKELSQVKEDVTDSLNYLKITAKDVSLPFAKIGFSSAGGVFGDVIKGNKDLKTGLKESGQLIKTFSGIAANDIKTSLGNAFSFVSRESVPSAMKQAEGILKGSFAKMFTTLQGDVVKGQSDALVENIKAFSDNSIVQNFADIAKGSETARLSLYNMAGQLGFIKTELSNNQTLALKFATSLISGFKPVLTTVTRTLITAKDNLKIFAQSAMDLVHQIPLSFWLDSANKGFAMLTSGLGSALKAFGSLTKKLLLNPFGLIAASIAAAVIGLKEFAESCIDDVKAFDKLHPEAQTVIDDFDDLKTESDAVSLALSSLSGKAINQTVQPIIKEFTDTILGITTSFKQWFSIISSGDFSNAFKKMGADFKAAFSTVAGVINQVGESTERLFGVKNGFFKKNSDYWADTAVAAKKTSQHIFEASDVGKEYEKELQLARDYIKQTEKDSKKTKDNLKDAKDELKEFNNIASNLTVVMEGDKFNFWNSKLLGDFESAKKIFEEQLKELDAIEFADEEAKALARQKLIEDYEKQIKDIRLKNAADVGDNEYIIQQKLNDAKLELDQKRAEQTISELTDYEKFLQDIQNLDETYAAQKQALEKLTAQAKFNEDFTQLQWLKEQDLAVEANYQQKKQQMELEYAQSTNDQLAAMKLQYLQEQAAKEQAFNQAQEEYWKSMKENSIQTIEQGLGDMFVNAIEGTGDMREAAYQMFRSLAKNIFTSSLSQVINNIIASATGAMSSQAAIPVIGPVLAAAASAAMLALLPVMKAKMSNDSGKIKYATGGYVSNGMVKGAFAGDSVQALLQPGERVLSKAETKAYEEAKFNNPGNIVNINVSIMGGFDRRTIQTEVREYLIPEIKRAIGQGYNLNPA